MREHLKNPIELMSRLALLDYASTLKEDYDALRDAAASAFSFLCNKNLRAEDGITEIIDSLSDALGFAGDDVDQRIVVIHALAALRTHPEYWAMPKFVHELIEKAREATHAG